MSLDTDDFLPVTPSPANDPVTILGDENGKLGSSLGDAKGKVFTMEVLAKLDKIATLVQQQHESKAEEVCSAIDDAFEFHSRSVEKTLTKYLKRIEHMLKGAGGPVPTLSEKLRESRESRLGSRIGSRMESRHAFSESFGTGTTLVTVGEEEDERSKGSERLEDSPGQGSKRSEKIPNKKEVKRQSARTSSKIQSKMGIEERNKVEQQREDNVLKESPDSTGHSTSPRNQSATPILQCQEEPEIAESGKRNLAVIDLTTEDCVAAVPLSVSPHSVEEQPELPMARMTSQSSERSTKRTTFATKGLNDEIEEEVIRIPPKDKVSWVDNENDTYSGESDDDSSYSCDDIEGAYDKIEARARAKSMAACQFELNQIEKSMSMSMRLKNGNLMQRLVRDPRFDTFAATLLITNTMIIGMQVEYFAHNPDGDPHVIFTILSTFYSLLFLFELILRILDRGLMYFFTESLDIAWNWFDFLVVALSIFELCIQFSNTSSTNNHLESARVLSRVVRIVRVIRIVRIIRVMRAFRPFRMMVTAILTTLKSCVWAATILIVIMYIFSVIFAESAIEHLSRVEREGFVSSQSKRLRVYYGTLPRSVFTMFMSILGGVDWEDVILPLSDLGWIYVFSFVFYISFVHLAVLNVVAGLFLQSAIEQAEQDQAHVIELRLQEKEALVERLKKLFYELDSSQDGSISLAEFEAHLKNEHMQAFLQTFDIENADAWTLFKLLDTDGGGFVDITEFVDGCIRLKGTAKSIQMCQLMYHHKWIMNKLLDLSDFVHDKLKNDSLYDVVDGHRKTEISRKSLGTLMRSQ